MTMASDVLPLHLKQTVPPIIWIFTVGEGDGIESRLTFKIFSNLLFIAYLFLVGQRFFFLEAGNNKIELLDIWLLKDMDWFHLENLLNWRKPRKMVFHRICNQRKYIEISFIQWKICFWLNREIQKSSTVVPKIKP